MAQTHEFTTADGVTVTAPLNLTRSQWEAFKDAGDAPTVDDLWTLADALGVPSDALGVIDVKRWGQEWSDAFMAAMGVGLGESGSSSTPSSESTVKPSRSTSAVSRKSR